MTEGIYHPERLRAMLSLLEDPDPEIHRCVLSDLDALGRDGIAHLEELWIQTEDELNRRMMEKIIRRLQLSDVLHCMEEWLRGDQSDLLSALCIVARYHYPNMDDQVVRQSLQSIRIEAWMGLNEQMTALEQIRHLNHVFYRVHKFRGNTEEYLNPNNNFINKVLETRRGNPLLVGLVYMLVAQMLGMPVYGVNLPQHFVLAFLEQETYAGNVKGMSTQTMHNRKPLFYINAFNMGSVFGKRDIDQFLKMVQIEPSDQYYRPCSHTEILLRLCANLQSSYRDAEEINRIPEIQKIMDIIRDYNPRNIE